LTPIGPKTTVTCIESLVTDQRVSAIEAAENVVVIEPEYHVRTVVASDCVCEESSNDIFEASECVAVGVGVVAQIDRHPTCVVVEIAEQIYPRSALSGIGSIAGVDEVVSSAA